MPVLSSRKTALNKAPASVSDIIVRRSQQRNKKVPMLKADKVPAGTYHSVILAVIDAVSEDDKPMADVIYRFTSSSGKVIEAKIRYPIVGYHIERLIDALIDAGLPEGSPLTDAVGIEEDVVVVYPQEGALGKIKNRRPASKAAKPASKITDPKKDTCRVMNDISEESFAEQPAEDFDDEFDDFLEVDEV